MPRPRLPYPAAFHCPKCSADSQFEAGRYRYCRPCGRVRVKARKNRKARKRWLSPQRQFRHDQRLLRRHAWLKAGDCTSADLRAIFAAAGGLCEYCDSAVKPRRMNKMKSTGFDHVLPMALGGRHTRTNIVVCCFACNSRKRDIHPDIFAPGLLARLAGMEAA